MRRHLHGALRLAVAVSAAIAIVAQQSEAASAATALSSGQWVTGITAPPAPTDYTASTTGPYWSAVVFVGDTLQALASSGTELAATTYRFGEPDYVAIDGNIRSPQTYTARIVTTSSVGEQYRMVFLNGNTVLSQGTTYIPPATTDQFNNAYIRDVYLTAGTSVQIVVAESGVTCPTAIGTLYLHAFLLGSDPSTPSTGVQSRSSALASSENIVQTTAGCAVKLHTNVYRSAWYGLLIFDYHSPQLTVILNSSSLVV